MYLLSIFILYLNLETAGIIVLMYDVVYVYSVFIFVFIMYMHENRYFSFFLSDYSFVSQF